MWTILENLLVTVLTIGMLLAGVYLLLLVLQWGLKLKTRQGEEEGLMNLWQSPEQTQADNDKAGASDADEVDKEQY